MCSAPLNIHKGELHMRLREFASAEDQLALLKLIMDHTWAALATQAAAQAQARTKAAGERKGKTKPKRTSARAPKAARVTKPSAPVAPATTTAAAAPSTAKKPSTRASTYPRPLPTNTAATSAEPKPVPWYQRPKELTPAQLSATNKPSATVA